MITSTIRALAAATLLSGWCAVSDAATTITVSGQAITLPDPSGLTALRNKESPYFRFGQTSQASNGNTLQAAFLAGPAARAADAGKVPEEIGRWALVYSLGVLEGKPVTVRMFNKDFLPGLEASIVRTFRDPDQQRRIQEGLDKGVNQIGNDLRTDMGKIRIGDVVPFGIFAKKENYLVYGVGSRVKTQARDGEAKEQPIVIALVFIVVKNRLFGVGVYGNYHSNDDIEEAKSRAVSWADAITRANP
jgi:hypothetical protein